MCSNYTAMSYGNPEMSSVYAPSGICWKEIATKAALTGALAGAAASVLVGGDSSVPFIGMQLPTSVAVGLGCAAGSVTGDLAHKYVLPHIPQNQKFQGVETIAISAGASILGAYAATMGTGLPLTTVALLGGGSFVGSDYVYHQILARDSGGFLL